MPVSNELPSVFVKECTNEYKGCAIGNTLSHYFVVLFKVRCLLNLLALVRASIFLEFLNILLLLLV